MSALIKWGGLALMLGLFAFALAFGFTHDSWDDTGLAGCLIAISGFGLIGWIGIYGND